MIIGELELKTLWGVVNAAHPDFADVAQAVTWAQQNNYLTVYIPAGVYTVRNTIVVDTPNFTLRGAGMWNTTLIFDPSVVTDPAYGLIVRPEGGENLIEGVHLVDFAIQPTTDNPLFLQSGVYLEDCRRVGVERVRSVGWYRPGETLPSSGFIAERITTQPQPPGGIVFNQCSAEDCFYGIWLTGSANSPLQRCSIIGASFHGPDLASGEAGYGSSQTQLVDTTTNFVAKGVQQNDWVHNVEDGSYAQVETVTPTTLTFKFPGLSYGETNIFQAGDPYAVVPDHSYGVHVERAKGTLVLGGEIANFDAGIYIGEGGIECDTDQTQIFGPKFDIIARGVYISAGVRKTQVVAMTRAQDYNYVEDDGLNSFVVGHLMNKLPADVDVWGMLDAAQLGGPGAGIRTYETSGTWGEIDLNFGSPASGFIGIYTVGGIRYFVTKIGDNWYQGRLTQAA